MAISHLLEDFSVAETTEPSTIILSEEELEDARLAAFEKGYSAGWEDALRAQEDAHRHVGEGLARAISDAEFTYHEALQQMTRALEPVFTAILDQLVPAAVHHGLAPRLLQALDQATREAAGRPLIVAVPVGAAPVLEPLLPSNPSLDVELREDPDLSEGQARLHLDEGGCEIDLTALAQDLRDAVQAYLYHSREDTIIDRPA